MHVVVDNLELMTQGLVDDYRDGETTKAAKAA